MEQLLLTILQRFISIIAILGGIIVTCVGFSIIFTNMTIQALIIGVFSVIIGGCLFIIGLLVSTI